MLIYLFYLFIYYILLFFYFLCRDFSIKAGKPPASRVLGDFGFNFGRLQSSLERVCTVTCKGPSEASQTRDTQAARCPHLRSVQGEDRASEQPNRHHHRMGGESPPHRPGGPEAFPHPLLQMIPTSCPRIPKPLGLGLGDCFFGLRAG